MWHDTNGRHVSLDCAAEAAYDIDLDGDEEKPRRTRLSCMPIRRRLSHEKQ